MPKELRSELINALGQARGLLEDLQRIGIGEVRQVPPEAAPESVMVPVSAGSGQETLEAVRADLGDCQRCGLADKRSNIVFGCGNPNADIVLVGEGPGRDEDRVGEPFVGEAGQLLDRILLAMGLHREQVYICNVVKCRPPGNRDPKEDEIAACEPFLGRQIDAIRPLIIIALGKFAAQTLLQTTTPITRLRGEWHQYRGIPLMPTFHPAYLLRNPSGKREVWDDMKSVLKKLRACRHDDEC